MKYNVVYSCGHKGVVNLIGPGRERERKLEWMSECALCPECFMKKKDAERDALRKQREKDNQAAAAEAKQKNWPALTGSAKQVAWAESIRKKFADKFMDMEPTEEGEMFLATIMANSTDARTWIDMRDESFHGKMKIYFNLYRSEDDKKGEKV